MKHEVRRLLVVLPAMLVGSLLASSPTMAQQRVAQQNQKLMVEGRGGVALPTGRLAKLADAGPNFGVQVGYPVNQRFSVNVEGDLDLFQGATLPAIKAPDMRVWRYGAGLETKLIEPQTNRDHWSITTNVGLGAASFNSDGFLLPNEINRTEFNHTYFTSNAGMRIGYAVNSRVTTQLGARAHWMSTDANDTKVLKTLDPVNVKRFGSAWSIPITFGLNFRV